MTIYSSTNPPIGFYVYAYLREKDSSIAKAGTPYYIGKGKGGRAFNKNGHVVPLPGNYTNIVFLETNLTDLGAQATERRMIRWYGRVSDGTGILRNMTDGGDGGVPCPSTVLRGQNHPGYGVKRPLTPEQRAKQKGKNKGNKWWNNGKIQTMSRGCPGAGWSQGRLPFDNIGAKIGTAKQRGKIWITNGESEMMLLTTDGIPEGYKEGRVPSGLKGKPNLNANGTRWWNNGSKTKMSRASPGPEWILGRL